MELTYDNIYIFLEKNVRKFPVSPTVGKMSSLVGGFTYYAISFTFWFPTADLPLRYLSYKRAHRQISRSVPKYTQIGIVDKSTSNS